MNSSKNYFFVLFFVIISFASAQKQSLNNKENQIALKEILTSLEEKYKVRFSFDSKLIEKYRVFSLEKQTDLDSSLELLAKETNLVFKKLDKRYIIIKEKKPVKNLKICGYLIDENSGTPIANATIWVPHKSLGVTSNSEGYFELKRLQSDWILRIDYLGYYSLKTPVFKMENSVCKKIALRETNEELEEVLVSDYLTKGMLKKSDGAISISPQNLGILPGLIEPDVFQTLQMLPGVQSPGETASDLHVRGGTPDQNLVLFDGIKMYESGHFFGLISSFNPYVTKKIKFYRSGTSARYGDRIGSVLSVSSGDAVPEFSAGFGLNLLHTDAYIKAPLLNDKVGLIISGRRSLTDYWSTATYKSFSESVFQNTRIAQDETEAINDLSNVDNNFFFHDYNLKVIADITADDKLVFSNLYNKNELEYYAENDRFKEKNTDNLAVQNQGSNIKWSRFWNSKWSHKIELNHSEYELNYFGEREITRRDPNNSVLNIFQKYNKVEDVGAAIDIENRRNEVSKWSYGYQYSKNMVNYLYETTGDNGNGNQSLESAETQNHTHALFSEYSFKKDQKWNLNIGLRLNYFSTVKRAYFEPRLFVSNQVSEAFQLKLSAEIKNQVLSQLIEFRNNGLGLENEIWALSNGEEIPVLNNYQITAGFLYQKNGWNLDVDAYTKAIDGLTILTEDVATRAPQYLSGTSTTNGVDVLLKKRFGNYRSWISYTFSKTKFLYDRINNGVAFDGEYDIPQSLFWSHTYSLKKFEFSLGWKIRSGTPYTEGVGIEQTPNGNYRVLYEDQVNTNRLPVYRKVDMSATYKFKLSKSGRTRAKLGISLINVLNRENILDRSYEIKIEKTRPGSPDLRTLVETDQISIGFTPNIVFRVDF